MKVQLLTHTPNPEKIVAAAAKLCYSNAEIDTLLDGLSEEKAKEFVEMLATLGHESPTEHAYFTFAIEGVSRSLLAQITRHRMASFSVQSQRYVELGSFDYVLPPAIAEDAEAFQLFESTMQQEAEAYEKLTTILKEKHKATLLAEGKTEKQAERAAAKMAIEDARFVLPNACNTKMIMTINTRSLNNFLRHRCCNRAQWEIRELAEEMYKLVYKVAPSLFVNSGPSCVAGACPEGKMTCGKIQEVRDKYAAIKNELTGSEV